MSFRSVLPVAVLSLCAFAAGCAATDEELHDEVVAETASALTAAPQKLRTIDVSSIVDGNVDASGTTSFVIDRNGKFPLVFSVEGHAVKRSTTGFEVKGDLALWTVLGDLTLAKAELTFERGDSGSLERLVGTVEMPAPGLGALEGFSFASPVRATIGYDLGANLKDRIDAPIADDRKYIAFDYAVGLSAKTGSVEFSMKGGKGGTFLLDPTDPSFYITGSLVGIDELGPLSDMALGLSARGLLPFEPKVTWGVEKDMQPFGGHVYGKGTLSFKRIPISIDGELVVNVDPDGKGRRLGSGTPDGVQLGANGQLNLDFDAKVVDMKIPLAKATLSTKITKQHQTAWISGETGPDADWMPSVMPLIPQSKARIAAFVSDDHAASHFNAEADLMLKANKIYGVIPATSRLGLRDVKLAQATLDADQSGLRAVGRADVPVIPVIKSSGGLTVTAVLPASNASDFFLTMNGDLEIGKFPLGSAMARIDKNGARIDGTFRTPVSEVAMSGSVTGSGADLTGTIAVDLQGLQDVIQKVTDAGTCGYTYGKDAAQCGLSYGQNAAECGSSYAASAAQCGTRTVESAAQCGEHYVTDAGICGVDTLKSAWACMKSGFTNCSAPKTCKIANSCQVANTCTFANSCTFASSCSFPATCDKHESKPASFGTFEGTLHVSASSSSASGSVAGKVCTGGSCVAVGSARVELGGHPKVCVSGLPGAVGEVCGNL